MSRRYDDGVSDILGPRPKWSGWTEEEKAERAKEREIKNVRKKYFKKVSSNLIDANKTKKHLKRANVSPKKKSGVKQKFNLKYKTAKKNDSSSSSSWSDDNDDRPSKSFLPRKMPKKQNLSSSSSGSSYETNTIDDDIPDFGQSPTKLNRRERPIHDACDHSHYERKANSLQQENSRLEEEVSKMSKSYSDLKKIRNLMIAKILVGNDEGEIDEEELMKLEIGELFKKFEKTYSTNSLQEVERKRFEVRIENLEQTNLNISKMLSNTDENSKSVTPEALEKVMKNLARSHQIETKKMETELKDVKEKYEQANGKLFLQYQIRDTLESQNREIMDILNIPEDDRSFSKFKETVLSIKNSYSQLKETLEDISMS